MYRKLDIYTLSNFVKLLKIFFCPPSMVYISFIIMHMLEIIIFHMLHLCGQLSLSVRLVGFHHVCTSASMYSVLEAASVFEAAP